MDLTYAYEKGYKQAAPKVLTSDEKAFLCGFNTAIHEVKIAFDNVDDVLSDTPRLAELEKEIISCFCKHIDCYISGAFVENVISFMDERLAESNKTCEDYDEEPKPHSEYKWFDKDAELEEPEDIVEESEENED